MRDYGTVLEVMEQPVYHVESGLVTMSLMVATIYQRPFPRLVLTREISTPNADAVTVSYTQISGVTLEDWKKSLEEADLMIWNPLPGRRSGPGKS